MTHARIVSLVGLGLAIAISAVACGASAVVPYRREGAAPAADLAVRATRALVEGGSHTDVNAAGLAAMLEKKDFPLINVHVPYEGEIEGTDLFIPYDEIESHLDRLPLDKNARIALYCRSGNMSASAARTLARLGYTDIWNLDGGMIAWKAAGYALVDKNRE